MWRESSGFEVCGLVELSKAESYSCKYLRILPLGVHVSEIEGGAFCALFLKKRKNFADSSLVF